MNKAKGVLKSKTMWFAGALVILGVIEMKLPGLKEHIPDLWFGVGDMVIGVSVAVLRWLTSTDLADK